MLPRDYPLCISGTWGPPDLWDFVIIHFNELFHFDFGKIQVPLPLEDPVIWLNRSFLDVRSLFVTNMRWTDILFATKKIMRCVAFMTNNIIVPALTACKTIEGTLTPGRGWTDDIVPACLPETLEHLRYSDISLPDKPEVLHYQRNMRCRKLPPIQTGYRRAYGVTVEGARSMASTLLHALTFGRVPVWQRDCFSGNWDLFRTVSRQRTNPTTVWRLQNAIAAYADQLCRLRRKLAQTGDVKDTGELGVDVATPAPAPAPLDFEKFAVLFISHFNMEACRILLENLVNSTMAMPDDIYRTRTVWQRRPVAAEMLLYPQTTEPFREQKLQFVLESLYKSVNDFTTLALKQLANERVLRILPFFGVDIEDTAPEVAKDVPVSNAVPRRQSSQFTRTFRRHRFSIRRFFRRNFGSQDAVVPSSVMEEHNSDSRRRPSLRSRVTSALKKLCCCCCRAEE
ncbi:uncharacterized protein LOC134462345 isoform X2 [Engraulis encrasicolus]|uniref:uncharacterized protein LOC134462345 isoform X2 n=1 Tax=Engraulis encrasicolus TaxID=184585 RepID=UPI002FD12ACD